MFDKEHMFANQKNGETAKVKTEIEGRTGVIRIGSIWIPRFGFGESNATQKQ